MEPMGMGPFFSQLCLSLPECTNWFPVLPTGFDANPYLANGPWNKSLNFIFPSKYVIPKSLKFSHWPSKNPPKSSSWAVIQNPQRKTRKRHSPPWNFRRFFYIGIWWPGGFKTYSQHMGVSKYNGLKPQIIHFNRVFHYFHHPFWGKTHYFWKHPYFPG